MDLNKCFTLLIFAVLASASAKPSYLAKRAKKARSQLLKCDYLRDAHPKAYALISILEVSRLRITYADKVVIAGESVCATYSGYQDGTGTIRISYAGMYDLQSCGTVVGTLAHELLHAVGLNHSDEPEFDKVLQVEDSCGIF